MTAPRPFWRDDHPAPASPGEGLPDSVDTLIIGAGYTGLAVARTMASVGAEVLVVDAGGVGAGASSVNGGQVNYGLKAATSTVFEMFGPGLGRELFDASLAAIDLVERIVDEDAISCDFRRGGAAELGYTVRDRRSFEHEAEWMAGVLDFPTRVVGPEQIRSEVVDSPEFYCALLDEAGAGLHPARYVDGLALAASRRGATIVEHAEVQAIERDGGGYRVITTAGDVQAATVVVATNGYTGGFIPELRRRVVPVGSYMAATEPLDPDTAERLIPHDRMLWTSRHLLHYLRRSPDHRILVGGRHDLAPDLDLAESAAELRNTTVRFFPELRDVAITHSWGGRLGVTFDLMPHIGRIDGVWYALGYGGHGVGLGTYLGTELGRLLTGEIDRSPFMEIPHPTRWYYRGRPWFLPFAAAWYRFLDRVGR